MSHCLYMSSQCILSILCLLCILSDFLHKVWFFPFFVCLLKWDLKREKAMEMVDQRNFPGPNFQRITKLRRNGSISDWSWRQSSQIPRSKIKQLQKKWFFIKFAILRIFMICSNMIKEITSPVPVSCSNWTNSNCIDMHLYLRQNSFQTENARKITQKMQIYQGMFL